MGMAGTKTALFRGTLFSFTAQKWNCEKKDLLEVIWLVVCFVYSSIPKTRA
jgi:hypothetical protein